MIELKTGDGYPIPYFINKLNKIIGKDKITTKNYYTISTNDKTYYTFDLYKPYSKIIVYNDKNFTGGFEAECMGSYSVIINNEYGTYDSIPKTIGLDLLATEKAVINFIEDNKLTQEDLQDILNILQ